MRLDNLATALIPAVLLAAACGGEPGAPLSLERSTVEVSQSSVDSGATLEIQLHARDERGDPFTQALDVSFRLQGGSSTGRFGSVSREADTGLHRVTFTGEQAGSSGLLVASIAGEGEVTGSRPALQVRPGAAALETSIIEVPLTTLAAGGAMPVTLTAKDAWGNRHDQGGLAVAFSLTGGTSTGTLGAVDDHGDGTYSASLTGVLAGTALTVGGTIGGAPVTTVLPTVTVVPAGASAATSELIADAGSVASGSAITVSLVARDAQGNRLTTGGLTVAFSHSGGAATGTFGATVDHLDGSYSAGFTGVTAGSATTLRASLGGAPVTQTAQVSVTPGPVSLSQSTIELSSTSVASGGEVTATLTARDSAANLLGVGGLPVGFSLEGGSSTGTFGAVTDHGDGTYSAPFTGVVAGTAGSVRGAIGGGPLTSAAPTLTVVPGPASTATSVVSASAAQLAAGSTSTITLTTSDANGNPLSTGGLSVAFEHTGGTSAGTFGGVTDLGNGSYRSVFTGTTAGTATTVRALLGGAEVTSTTPVTVEPGPVASSTTTVIASPTTVPASTVSDLLLTARDAFGNRLTAGGLTVAFGLGGGTSAGFFGPVTDHADGTYSAGFTGTTPGSAATLTATIDGSPVSSATPQLTVVPGPPRGFNSRLSVSAATVPSGSSLTATLTTRDEYDNPCTAGGAVVTFAYQSTSGASGSFGVVTDNGDGTYEVTFTGVSAGSGEVRATVGGEPVFNKPAVTVEPGPVEVSRTLIATSAPTVKVGRSLGITATLRDASDNPVGVGGATVLFSHSGGTSAGSFGATVDQGDGTYTSTFTGVTEGSATTLVATVSGTAVSGPEVTVISAAINLVTQLELLARRQEDTTSAGEWTQTLTALDTGDYDGTVSYELELDATNSGAPVSVDLRDHTSTKVAGIALATGASGRFSAAFTPTAGASVYRLYTPAVASGTLTLTSARIRITQVNATRTRLHFPLLHNKISEPAFSPSGSIMTKNGGGGYTFLSPWFSTFNKVSSRYSQLAASTPWTLEVVADVDAGGSSNTALFNRRTGAQVSGSLLTHSSTTTLASTHKQVSFSDLASNFSDGDTFELRWSVGPSNLYYGRLYRATLSVKLDPIVSGESCFQLGRAADLTSAETTFTPRSWVTLSEFSEPALALQAEAKGSATSLGLWTCDPALTSCAGVPSTLTGFSASSTSTLRVAPDLTGIGDAQLYQARGTGSGGVVSRVELCVGFQ